MIRNVTQDLFRELQALLPGLPDNIIEMTLCLRRDSFPVVTCMLCVTETGVPVERTKVFELVEREAFACESKPQAPPPNSVTKIGE